MHHIKSHRLETGGGSAVRDRAHLLFNQDIKVSLVKPTAADDFFYRNGRADELIYITRGGGVLESQYGNLTYREGDYLVIPRGIVHRLVPGEGQQIHLVMESRGYVRTPKRYRSMHGQLLEHSPSPGWTIPATAWSWITIPLTQWAGTAAIIPGLSTFMILNR